MPNIATNDRVDRAGLEDFVRDRHRMTLLTLRRDGRPQMSPVTGGLDAEIATAPSAGVGKINRPCSRRLA